MVATRQLLQIYIGMLKSLTTAETLFKKGQEDSRVLIDPKRMRSSNMIESLPYMRRQVLQSSRPREIVRGVANRRNMWGNPR